jgi:hypothetical protein
MLACSEQDFKMFVYQFGQYFSSFGMEQTEKYQTRLRES